MIVVEYATAPTGTVHLHHPFAERTLCGWNIDPAWTSGDETPSGIGANCASCRRALSRAKDKESRE